MLWMTGSVVAACTAYAIVVASKTGSDVGVFLAIYSCNFLYQNDLSLATIS